MVVIQIEYFLENLKIQENKDFLGIFFILIKFMSILDF